MARTRGPCIGEESPCQADAGRAEGAVGKRHPCRASQPEIMAHADIVDDRFRDSRGRGCAAAVPASG